MYSVSHEKASKSESGKDLLKILALFNIFQAAMTHVVLESTSSRVREDK